jgi:hypothetical protein
MSINRAISAEHFPLEGNKRTLSADLSIDELIVVAGPTAVGKTTLTQHLVAGGGGPLVDAIGVATFDDWTTLSIRPGILIEGSMKRVIVQYDIIRPYRKGLQGYERDRIVPVLEAAGEVTFVTLWAPPEILKRQLIAAEFGGRRLPEDLVRDGSSWQILVECMGDARFGVRKALRVWRSYSKKDWHLHLLHKYDTNWVNAWYARWFSFCESFGDRTRRHLVALPSPTTSAMEVVDLDIFLSESVFRLS